MRPILLAATIVLAMFSGCFGEDVEPVQVSEFSVEAPESVLRDNTSVSRSLQMLTGQ